MPRQPRQRLAVVADDRLFGQVARRHHERHARPRRAAARAAASSPRARQPADCAAPPRTPAARPRAGPRGRSAAPPTSGAPLRRSTDRRSPGRRASPATITANGFSSRCFRSRRRRTASSEVASHASWNPPIPLRATMSPSRSARAASAIGSAVEERTRRRRRAGPGAARRPDRRWAARGSGGPPPCRTRAGTIAHIANAAIVVAGRSYGAERTMVKRGPQFGAVRERIVIAPIGRVVDLGEAIGAGREVRRDRDVRIGRRGARDDREPGRRSSNAIGSASMSIDDGGRGARGVVSQPLDERVERAGGAEGFDRHAGGVVPHAAGHRRGLRHAIDPRPEADALHGALHPDAAPGCESRRRRGDCRQSRGKIRTVTHSEWQAQCHASAPASARKHRHTGRIRIGCRISGSGGGD